MDLVKKYGNKKQRENVWENLLLTDNPLNHRGLLLFIYDRESCFLNEFFTVFEVFSINGREALFEATSPLVCVFLPEVIAIILLSLMHHLHYVIALVLYYSF